MAGWKPKDLKTKSFANVQELFDKAMKRVNIFVDMDTELVGGSEVRAKGSETITQEISLKRAGDELEQENAKKQKVDDDQETAELQSMMKIVPDEEEVVVDAIPLAIKPPSIIDYKIIKEGKISNYQIIRADGNSKRRMLPNTSLILKLFCEKFKKQICHFTKIINLKLLVQHISSNSTLCSLVDSSIMHLCWDSKPLDAV
ncbi:hypothetical protein Tco_0942763 [Tanacetum coccineum]